MSCSTFVVLPPATKNGTIIFAKNSDRPAKEVSEVVYYPPQDHGDGKKVKCTYIEIDQVPHTHSVILSKPAWMWGAEMGSNEHGVCIGNEAVFTKLLGVKSKEEKLLGMDLLRLGLERSKTAAGALKVMTSLLETHGQGGPCYEDSSSEIFYHNSYIIVDRQEAWILETADKLWAAERLSDGPRNICNILSITTKIDAMTDGLEDHAKSNGFSTGSPFNFAACYQGELPQLIIDKTPTNQLPDNRLTEGKRLLQKYSAGGNFTVKDMFNILRNEESGICRSGAVITASSMVSVLTPLSSKVPCTHWLTATPNPQHSVFKPFVFVPNVSIGDLTTSPVADDDPAKMIPRFQREVCREHELYKYHAMGERLMEVTEGKELRNTLVDLESLCVQDMEEYLQSYDESKCAEIKDLFRDIVESEVKFYK